MAWIKTRPATSEAVKTGWPVLLANQAAIEAALDQDHDFTTGSTQTGKHNKVSLIEAADIGTGAEGLPILGSQTAGGKAELVFTDEDDNDVQITDQGHIKAVADALPAGTKMWFYANTAPSGWTIDGTPSDELLGIKGGATYTTGGAQAGTWTQPNHLHTTPDHQLTINEMPAHTHVLDGNANTAGAVVKPLIAGAGDQDGATESRGGDAVHNHGNTGNSATANTWRPLARVGIICSKDSY